MRLGGNTTQTKGSKADRPWRETIQITYVDREVQKRPTAVVAIEGLKSDSQGWYMNAPPPIMTTEERAEASMEWVRLP